jgi:hypothetical protein
MVKLPWNTRVFLLRMRWTFWVPITVSSLPRTHAKRIQIQHAFKMYNKANITRDKIP